jgi:hypothetical protein
LPARAALGDTGGVIKDVIVHLTGDLPIVVDLYEAPGPTSTSVRCTNVRTVDGKRPKFIQDPRATFLLAWHLIRLMEVPAGAVSVPEVDGRVVVSDPVDAVSLDPEPDAPEPDTLDEEAEEDLLARIRSI